MKNDHHNTCIDDLRSCNDVHMIGHVSLGTKINCLLHLERRRVFCLDMVYELTMNCGSLLFKKLFFAGEMSATAGSRKKTRKINKTVKSIDK